MTYIKINDVKNFKSRNVTNLMKMKKEKKNNESD